MRTKTSLVRSGGPVDRSGSRIGSSAVFAQLAETILAEVPRTLRRVGLLLLMLSISVPVFLVGLLVVLWRLGG
jgi:hypothetical protein